VRKPDKVLTIHKPDKVLTIDIIHAVDKILGTNWENARRAEQS
jgi:hypothetical protein